MKDPKEFRIEWPPERTIRAELSKPLNALEIALNKNKEEEYKTYCKKYGVDKVKAALQRYNDSEEGQR